MVHPGLEEIAGDEITHDLGGEVKRTAPGLVVFRVGQSSTSRSWTAHGRGRFPVRLGHRSADLPGRGPGKIRRWTARDADWRTCCASITPSARSRRASRPTAWSRRWRASTATCAATPARRWRKGLAGKLPASWRPAEENAAVEVWLTIHGGDGRVRPAAVGPDHAASHLQAGASAGVAAADAGGGDGAPGRGQAAPRRSSIRCAAPAPSWRSIWSSRQDSAPRGPVWAATWSTGGGAGGGHQPAQLGSVELCAGMPRRLPLADASVDRVSPIRPSASNSSDPEAIDRSTARMVREYDRVLRPGGRAVLLVSAGLEVVRTGRRGGGLEELATS